MNLNHFKQDIINEINNAIDDHGDENWQIVYDTMIDELATDHGAEFLSNKLDLIDEVFENFVETHEFHNRICELAKINS